MPENFTSSSNVVDQNDTFLLNIISAITNFPSLNTALAKLMGMLIEVTSSGNNNGGSIYPIQSNDSL